VKVNSSVNKPCDFSIGDPRRASEHGAEKTRRNESTSGSVQLSAASIMLQTLVEQSGDGIFDAAKVEEIKLAIAEGRFQVKPEKVADGLIAQVMDLLQPGNLRA
jgi:negative regulator of flagellin synthesis FlgM